MYEAAEAVSAMRVLFVVLNEADFPNFGRMVVPVPADSVA
jgi:hypothetical protein